MDKKILITISRQYGSGGREIGRKLAKKLNIPFYDRQLIEMAAKESGINEELLAIEDEHAGYEIKLLATIRKVLGNMGTLNEMTLNDRMFIAQCNVIEQIAQAGSAVIVGRCADYILENNTECIDIYIYADQKAREKRAVEEYGIKPSEVTQILSKTDQRRIDYYNHYTNKIWGKAENYHVSIDSSRFSSDKIVEILATLIMNNG